MRVLQHDAGGGRETTVSFGVALVLYNAQINKKTFIWLPSQEAPPIAININIRV